MSKSKENLLWECARELGGGLLESAVLHAETAEQLSNQITTLQLAAQHILAVCAFNSEMFEGEDGDFCIDDFADEIKAELYLLKNTDDMTPVFLSGKAH